MASAKCAVIDCKRNGESFCDHCQGHVCPKHYVEHIQLASEELPQLSKQLNELLETIEEHDFTKYTFEQIDKWQKESYQRIDQLCKERKEQVKMEIDQKIHDQISKLRDLTEEIEGLINEGYASFKVVANLKKTLEECREQCQQLERDNYFQLDIKGINLGATLCNHQFFEGGTLLSLEHQIKLNDFYNKPGQVWKLIYKATRDGFSTTDFHRCCNNQGPTVTVIQSAKYDHLFGGYTSISWSSRQAYAADANDPFLFTLTNPHGIPPTKYEIKLRNHAIYDHANYGPTFGAGFDLCVKGPSETNSFSFPHSYVDTTKKGFGTFTGERNFQMKDIEVYQRTHT